VDCLLTYGGEVNTSAKNAHLCWVCCWWRYIRVPGWTPPLLGSLWFYLI